VRRISETSEKRISRRKIPRRNKLGRLSVRTASSNQRLPAARGKESASSGSPALAPLTDHSTGNMNPQILSSGFYGRRWPLKLCGDERKAFSRLGHCAEKLVVFCRPPFTAKATHYHIAASRAAEAGPHPIFQKTQLAFSEHGRWAKLKGGFERFRLLRRYCQTPAFQSELRKCNHVIHIDQLASAFREICHQVEHAFPDTRVIDTDKLLYEFQALF
jgi:hypothetical protein